MINIKKINSTLLSFLFLVLPISMFFGLGISTIFSESLTSTLLVTLITLIPIIIHMHIYCNLYNNYDILNEIKNVPKIISIFWVITIIITLFLIVINAYYETHYFIVNNYLTKTPEILIDIMLCLTLLYMVSKGEIISLRVSFILIISSFLMFVINIFSLIPYIKIINIYPIYNYDIKSILTSSFIFFSLFTGPLFITSFYKKENLIDPYNIKKKMIINTFISFALLFIILFLILSILGINLINIFEYPEYVVLKKLKISFIERIENIGFCIWGIMSLIASSFSCLYIKRIINETFNIKDKYLQMISTLIIIILLILIPRIFFDTNDFAFKKLFNITPYILFIVFDGTIYLLFIKDKLNKLINKKTQS